MEIDRALDELYDRKDNMLTMEEAAGYLNEPEYEVAYKVHYEDIESFKYQNQFYIPLLEVRGILEGRLKA
jgi:hypothetical protein